MSYFKVFGKLPATCKNKIELILSVTVIIFKVKNWHFLVEKYGCCV